MSLIADITLHDPFLFGPTFDAVPSTVCEFEDIHYIAEGDEAIRYVFFGWAGECDFTEFEEALASDPTVDSYRSLTEFDSRRLYRLTTCTFPDHRELVFPFFRKHDIMALRVERTRTGLELRARFPDRSTLRKFLEMSRSVAERSTVERLFTETPTEPSTRELTTKQYEALSLAYARGYFDTPSQITLDELARELDVSPQTLSQHIRRGLEQIVGEAVDPVFNRAMPKVP